LVRLLGINILNLRNAVPVLMGLLVALTEPAGARSTDNLASTVKGGNSSVSAKQQANVDLTHVARGIVQMQINAPREAVWHVLTNFSSYPEVFNRIQSCKVTKKEGALVFTESLLKPHMFLNQPWQHAVNDLTNAPSVLTWHATDGNFKSMGGKWELRSNPSDSQCTAVYTLEVDPGGCVPPPLVSFLMHSMQKEIVTSVKKSAELNYQEDQTASKLPAPASSRRNG
jgi:ribosome-associated toxin RatA of RatAB toxin-antitoxin module